MAYSKNNFRVPWKHAQVFQDLPAIDADGGRPGDPVVANGQVGVNLWGTGQGEGIPAGSDYGMVALDGTVVVTIPTLGNAVTEGSPIYITAANELTDAEDDGGAPATAYTLFGWADEPAAAGTDVRIGIRIKAQVNA